MRRCFRDLGADGIVVGFLKPDGDLDMERLKVLKEKAGTGNMTLHRAFDVCRDPYRSLKEAIEAGADTILTSGQQNTCMEGKKLLGELMEQAAGQIDILVGSGVNVEAIACLMAEIDARCFHMSGKGNRGQRHDLSEGKCKYGNSGNRGVRYFPYRRRADSPGKKADGGESMFTEERLDRILQLLHDQGMVKVKDLSALFQVTEDCIRKDLKNLENAGKLKRTYGGALLSQDYPLKRDVIDRRDTNIEKKKLIAQKAFELIRSNETIFLDISTTNIMVAEQLAKSHKRLTVVTNMIDIMQTLAVNPDITSIGTGGIMYRTVNGFMGAAAIEIIKQYSFDRAFIGTCGLDLTDNSITTLGVEDGLTKKAAIASSRHKYLVMEKDKFYFNDSYKFAHFDDIDGIITDSMPDEATARKLYSAGVTIQ
jgi:DeoR/GlpR family transcriptional regulator of sugar metabolism